MSSTSAIRKGMILSPSVYDYNYNYNYAAMGNFGAAGRIRTLSSMKTELSNRKKALAKFQTQLKSASNQTERKNINHSIKKYKRKISALNKSISAKSKRKGRRKRWGSRQKSRFSLYSGLPETYEMIDYDEDLSGPMEYWSQYKSWWVQQNPVVQIAVPSLFLIASFKVFKALTKKKKGRK